MSEAELHVLRARLEGGIRNKAARGELRAALPVGLVWGERGRRDPDRSRRGDQRRDPARSSSGSPSSGRSAQVWLWLRREGCAVPDAPLRPRRDPVGSRRPTTRSTACSRTRSMPAPTRSARPAGSATSTSTGRPRQRIRRLPQAEWEVLISDHHPGFIDLADVRGQPGADRANTRPRAHEPGGAVREGQALLQGIAVCGRCGRKLKVHYKAAAGTRAPPITARQHAGRGPRQLVPAGRRRADRPGRRRRVAGRAHPRRRQGRAAGGRGARARPRRRAEQWRLQVERAQYEAERAERRYREVEPEHRLVARGLERDWEHALARARQGRSRARAARAATTAHAHRRTSASSCSRSAPTSAACGRRRRPPTATASSCCAA